MTPRNGVGGALRGARMAKEMSLSDVAQRAGVSVATLSRIETGKQSIDVSLLVRVSEIVGIDPGRALSDDGQRDDASPADLARALATLTPPERARIMVRANKESRRARSSRHAITAQIDNLLAAIDVMVEELTELRRHARRRS